MFMRYVRGSFYRKGTANELVCTMIEMEYPCDKKTELQQISVETATLRTKLAVFAQIIGLALQPSFKIKLL